MAASSRRADKSWSRFGAVCRSECPPRSELDAVSFGVAEMKMVSFQKCVSFGLPRAMASFRASTPVGSDWLRCGQVRRHRFGLEVAQPLCPKDASAEVKSRCNAYANGGTKDGISKH